MICIWSSWCHYHPVISCFIAIQNGLSFLVPAYWGCPGKKPLNGYLSYVQILKYWSQIVFPTEPFLCLCTTFKKLLLVRQFRYYSRKQSAPKPCWLLSLGPVQERHVCRPTISSALLLALVHALEIKPSPLPDHAFVFPHMSVDLICPLTLFTGNRKRI